MNLKNTSETISSIYMYSKEFFVTGLYFQFNAIHKNSASKGLSGLPIITHL